ncbi:MAG: Bro-N domain-containing protein [bacterium]
MSTQQSIPPSDGHDQPSSSSNPPGKENFQLMLFNYGEHAIRTTIDEHGLPWWVAKDVCEVLEMSNTSKALQGLDDDEKGITKSYTLGGTQEMLVINESGLYTLILRSNKPEAKPFRKWVTSEVLPSLRKTGSYTMPGATTPFNPDPEKTAIEVVREVMQYSGFEVEIAFSKSTSKIKIRSTASSPDDDLPKGQRVPGRCGFKVDELSENAKAEAISLLKQGMAYEKVSEAIMEKFNEKISAAALCRYNRLVLQKQREAEERVSTKSYTPGTPKEAKHHE